ncbi:hypothetical protein ACIQCD_17695 [Streptomyces sp. NPDC093250]|uniref:hypothetical protein n=1 Tax=unclassified Streptomyces TaxID=2593676 RepID=UPI00343043C9
MFTAGDTDVVGGVLMARKATRPSSRRSGSPRGRRRTCTGCSPSPSTRTGTSYPPRTRRTRRC